MTQCLTIVHVLPALLGSYGDVGNVLVLRHRAVSRGIEVRIVDVAPGDPVPGSADLYVIGGGQGDEEVQAAELLRADTGHVVAFDDTIKYSVRKAGSWKTSLLGGEGLVTDFAGPGRVWMQTRSTPDFVSWLISVMPTTRS